MIELLDTTGVDRRPCSRRALASRKTARRLASVLTLAFLSGAFGCADTSRARGERPEFDASREHTDAPSWVRKGCRSHWKGTASAGHVICATGSAPPARNRSRARETAIARARTEMTRSLEVTIETMFAHRDDGSHGGRGELTDISQQVAMASLPRCSVEAIWSSPNGTTHALVALTQNDFEASVREAPQLPETIRRTALEGAEAAFADLDPETRPEAEPKANPDNVAPQTTLDAGGR